MNRGEAVHQAFLYESVAAEIRESATHKIFNTMHQDQVMSETTTPEQQVTFTHRDMEELEHLREEVSRLELCCRAAEKKLEKEKKLKDVYIERGKVQRRELEKLHFYDEAGTLSNEKISQLVRTKSRHTNKRNLLEDYEELQVAHMISQKELQEELQQVKDRCQAVEQELEDTKLSYQNISSRYDTEVSALRQQVDFFHNELEKERRAHENRLLDEVRVMSELRAEKDALRQEMAQEYIILQQKAFENERELLKEYDELKMKLSLQKFLHQEEMKEVYKSSQEMVAAERLREKEKNQVLQEEHDSLRASFKELSQKYEAVVSTVQQQAEVIQSSEGRINEYQQVFSTMKTQQDALQKEMAEERTAKESALRLNEDLRTQLNHQISVVNELMKEKESQEKQADTTSCQEGTEESEESVSIGPSVIHQEDLEDQITVLESPVLEAPAVGGLESEGEPEVSSQITKPSAWKTFRHAVGLRKPKRWKKKKQTESSTPEPLPSDSPSPSPSD